MILWRYTHTHTHTYTQTHIQHIQQHTGTQHTYMYTHTAAHTIQHSTSHARAAPRAAARGPHGIDRVSVLPLVGPMPINRMEQRAGRETETETAWSRERSAEGGPGLASCRPIAHRRRRRRVTKDPIYRQWGWEIFQAFERSAPLPPRNRLLYSSRRRRSPACFLPTAPLTPDRARSAVRLG